MKKKIFAVVAGLSLAFSFVLIAVGTVVGLVLVIGAPGQFDVLPIDFISGGLVIGLGFYIFGRILLEKAGLL